MSVLDFGAPNLDPDTRCEVVALRRGGLPIDFLGRSLRPSAQAIFRSDIGGVALYALDRIARAIIHAYFPVVVDVDPPFELPLPAGC